MDILCRTAAVLCLWQVLLPAGGAGSELLRGPRVRLAETEAGSARPTRAAGARDTPEEFEGYLEKGRSYSADVVCDKDTGLRLKKRIKMPYHHAVRVEWLNLPEIAKSQDCELRLVFEVVSKEVYPIDPPRRWNTTYTLRVLRRLS